jgi:hypothetical protein
LLVVGCWLLVVGYLVSTKAQKENQRFSFIMLMMNFIEDKIFAP